jgi:hypothetical protein
MSIGQSRPLQALDKAEVEGLPSSCGVYELVSMGGEIVKIGVAGAREPFGLRSSLSAELLNTSLPLPVMFRYEVNMQYWGRWRELLIRFVREQRCLPSCNVPRDIEGVLPLGLLARELET